MHINRKIKPGDRFGKLVVTERILGSKKNARVKCDCGTIFDTYTYNLANGKTFRCARCVDRKGKPCYANRIDPLERTINEQYNVFRKNARKRGEVFLSRDEWLELAQRNCVYCGEGPSNIRRASVPHAKDFSYNGIDRIDSSRGYEQGNVQPACWICNRAKSNMSHEEFVAWVCKVANQIKD